MLQALQSVISLLLGAGILILGNGLVGIVLPVRMSLEHVPTEISGLVMSAYYGGLVLGCLWSRDLIVRVGHIRAFAAFAGAGGGDDAGLRALVRSDRLGGCSGSWSASAWPGSSPPSRAG